MSNIKLKSQDKENTGQLTFHYRGNQNDGNTYKETEGSVSMCVCVWAGILKKCKI